MGRKKISISKINDERNRQVCIIYVFNEKKNVFYYIIIYKTIRLHLQNVNLD